MGTAWAIEGGLNAASHLMDFAGGAGGGTDSDQSRSSGAADIQTLKIRIDSDSDSAPRAQPVRARAARQQPSPFGVNPVPLPRPQGQSSGSEGSRFSRQSAATAGPWEPNRRSTSSGVTSNSPDLIGERQARWRT